MNVEYYPTSDTEQAQLFNCCTLPQNNLTYPLQPVIYIG